MRKIDFNSYSDKELLQAFETVNDELYPDTAMCIYKLILERANLKADSNTCQKLGY